ncbi:MAG: fumarylacetoacetate hydrolase family protein, partial [Woeseiaceae bacterium]|nr:fumarylacetoacetate hydrolase family protein [Woeseiaceae bacterium]
MRALSFIVADRASFGVARDDGIHEASREFRDRFADLRDVLRAGALDELDTNVDGAALSDPIHYLPTVPNPGKILCVGVNYRPHAEEMGRELPAYPLLFARFPDSVVGHEQPLLAPVASLQYDFEGEVAVVIGRRAHRVSAADAAEVVAGYSAFMDGSVRDWQRHTSQFLPGKNFAASGAFGPWLVTPDERPPGQPIRLETRVNG